MENTSNCTPKRIYGPKLFVGRIGPSTTPASMRNYFKQVCKLQIAKIEYSRKSKKHKGFGYIIVEDENEVNRVMSQNHRLDGKSVYITRYGLDATYEWYKNKENAIQIKVTEIPMNVTETEIASFFEKFGPVLVVNVFEEESQIDSNLKRYALLRILNTGKNINIGQRAISCSTSDIQCIQYTEISNLLQKLVQSELSSENEVSPLTSSIHERKQSYFPKMVFGDYNEDKHSKYEFIGVRHNRAEMLSNYRFNITLQARRSLMANRPDGSDQEVERREAANEWHWLPRHGC